MTSSPNSPRWLLRYAALEERLIRRDRLAVLWLELTTATVVLGALYGAVIGSWTGPRMALYAAFKLPLVLEITMGVTLVSGWLVALLAGVRLSLSQAALLAALPLAVAALILASLTPVAAFFTFCAPPPVPEARTTHNLLYLVHTFAIAAAGLGGSLVLLGPLGRMAPSRRSSRAVFLAWISVYALVGGEVAWALRPFVGSVYLPVRFLREAPLDGNVYEFVLTDILPHLFGGG